MLFSIGTRRPARAPLDGIELLEECHGRIRSFMDLARRLAEDRHTEHVLRAEAARSVHRYFATALPLHVLDEDTSLMPRLWRGADTPLRDAIVSMADQHGDIEETVADLLAEWRDVSVSGCRLPPFVLRETEALDFQWTIHLDLEERLVFPAAKRLLPPDELAQIAAEIRARRAVSAFFPLEGSPSGALQ